jgi:hypothetical protein
MITSVLNRAAAAIAGAALTGLLCGLTISAVFASVCIGRTCEDPFGFPIYFGTEGAIGALVLGSIPGLIALSITPARTHPWRALLILVPASALGFGLFAGLMAAAPHLGDSAMTFVLLLFALPSTTGFAAALNIKRIPFWDRAA